MATYNPDPDRHEFNNPFEYDAVEGQHIIYLNKDQENFLKAKKKEYEERLKTPSSDPVLRLDAKIKFLLVSMLLDRGYATLEDVVGHIQTEYFRGIPRGEIAELLGKILHIIGSYNTGKPEHLAQIGKGHPLPDHQKRRTSGDIQGILEARHVTNNPSHLESKIGFCLRALLQSDEAKQGKYAIESARTRKALLEDIWTYMRIRKIKSLPIAVEQLSKELTASGYIAVSEHDIRLTLNKIVLDAPVLKKFVE